MGGPKKNEVAGDSDSNNVLDYDAIAGELKEGGASTPPYPTSGKMWEYDNPEYKHLVPVVENQPIKKLGGFFAA
jgi:hypothetical protein